jgi:hypothetical protein
MTPDRVELVRRLFEPYGNLDGYGPALELVEHAKELQALVLELAEHMASPPGPEKVAGHYQAMRLVFAMQAKITPPRGASIL